MIKDLTFNLEVQKCQMKTGNALQHQARLSEQNVSPMGTGSRKQKITTWNSSFLTANRTISGAERQPEEWEKNLCLLDFRNDWQQSAKIKPKTPEQPVSKRANETNRQFSKEEARRASQCLQKVFNVPSVREMQTKTILRCLLICLTPGRRDLSKRPVTNATEEGGERGSWAPCRLRECRLVRPLGKSV